MPTQKRRPGAVPVISSSGHSGYHSEFMCSGENVITGRYGTIGEVYYFCGKCWPLNTTLFVKDFKGNNPRYIYYFLKNALRTYKVNGKDKSTVPGVDRNVLHMMQVSCHIDTDYQEEIATVLTAIDKKIQINCQICTELEAMAKTLYDYWFTQFDFPSADGKPYRSSGGEMIWNEQLKRKIPKGWKIATINAMATSSRGVSYDSNDIVPSSKEGILVLRGNNIQDNHLVYDRNVVYIPEHFVDDKQHIKAHDIILTMSSGSKEHIGKCAMFQFDSLHTYGAFLSKFTPQTDKVFFVFLSMISDYFKRKVKAICNGTGINNLSHQTFDEIFFPLPDGETLQMFENIVAPYFSLIGYREKESQELTKLRDWLLPMLMSGQATVL